jgi:hypothetical protein
MWRHTGLPGYHPWRRYQLVPTGLRWIVPDPTQRAFFGRSVANAIVCNMLVRNDLGNGALRASVFYPHFRPGERNPMYY